MEITINPRFLSPANLALLIAILEWDRTDTDNVMRLLVATVGEVSAKAMLIEARRAKQRIIDADVAAYHCN